MDDEFGFVELQVENLQQVPGEIRADAEALGRFAFRVDRKEAERVLPRVSDLDFVRSMFEG